ncbi:hypothetical protein LBR_08540 [Levilactobacillus brevis]|uniref:hypothetical protein n=1 Tax=Levilactobacillus brevis TaxID=1580 RepID=UPI000A10F20A|nr:hypothetical protein [Levilactobacillus brevis]ORJ53967.1 hypothetical protein LBR_08540 [Levilactobacillus brevis]
MKPSEDARIKILKALSGHKNTNPEPFSKVMQDLLSEYNDEQWLDSIVIAMDIKHEGLINMEFKQDYQGRLLPLVPAGSDSMLTPDGEYEANQY